MSNASSHDAPEDAAMDDLEDAAMAMDGPPAPTTMRTPTQIAGSTLPSLLASPPPPSPRVLHRRLTKVRGSPSSASSFSSPSSSSSRSSHSAARRALVQAQIEENEREIDSLKLLLADPMLGNMEVQQHHFAIQQAENRLKQFQDRRAERRLMDQVEDRRQYIKQLRASVLSWDEKLMKALTEPIDSETLSHLINQRREKAADDLRREERCLKDDQHLLVQEEHEEECLAHCLSEARDKFCSLWTETRDKLQERMNHLKVQQEALSIASIQSQTRTAEKRFRSMLMERDGVSPVSGSSSENSQAARIVEVKHWRQFDPSSVDAMPSYTVRNGLLLDPNDHKFFDDHNFTIKAEDGEHGIRYFIELAPGWEPPERASHLQQGKEIKFKGPQESWPAMEYLVFRLKLFESHNKMHTSAGPRDRFRGDSDCALDHEELLSFPQDPIMAKGSPGDDEGALACGPPLSDCADFVGQWVADVAKRMDLSGGAA